jgi:hypothetical protein
LAVVEEMTESMIFLASERFGDLKRDGGGEEEESWVFPESWDGDFFLVGFLGK